MITTNAAAVTRDAFNDGISIFTEKKLHSPSGKIDKEPEDADHAGVHETTCLSYDTKEIAGNPCPIDVRSVDSTLVAHLRKVDRVCLDISRIHALGTLHGDTGVIRRAERGFPRKLLRIDPAKSGGDLPASFTKLGMIFGSLFSGAHITQAKSGSDIRLR